MQTLESWPYISVHTKKYVIVSQPTSFSILHHKHNAECTILTMLIIGLTGSIATGKSTVASILSSQPHSLPLIDADLLARQAVRPGTHAYNSIVKYFSPTTPDLLLPTSPPFVATPDEKEERGRPLNRAALGRRVFGTTPSRIRDRKVLNSIVHPAVRLLMLQSIIYYHFLGNWAVVLDIPLLYESGLDIFCGAIIVVAVSSPEVQMQRLQARDRGLSSEEAKDRVLSQMGVREKVGRCKERGDRGLVVWNDGGREELRKQVSGVVKRLESGRGFWWMWWLWVSPFVALAIAAWEVWKGWRAKKRWEEGKRGRDV